MSGEAGRAGNVRTMNRDRRSSEHALGRRRVRRARARRPGDRGRFMPLKAPSSQPVFDWTGFYIGAPYRLRPRLVERGALRSAAVATTGNVFSGVIGGVQAGYNVRLPSGLLLGVEADMTFPNYLTSNSIVSTLTDARAPTSSSRWDYVGTVRGRIGYASGPLAGLRHRRPRLCRRTLHQHARVGTDEKHHQRPARLGRRRRCRICLRAALERAARISLQPVRPRQRSLSLGHAIQFDARLPADAHRPQPQGRLAGLERAGRRRPT